jgi:hypothetical protein
MQSKGPVIIAVVLLLAILGRQKDHSDQVTADSEYSSQGPSGVYPTAVETDITQLSCAQLDFMMKKYTSIGDQAARLANSGNSPAASASAITAMQAYNQVTRDGNERARRCF